MKTRIHYTLLFICVVMIIGIFPTMKARADGEVKTVRAGWHEEPYFIIDKDGRRSGYSYEYQQKVTSYTGWEYEYVEGTWSELTQMLKEGKIDILANMSYTEERAKEYLFTSFPMGTESYYVLVSPDNDEIKAEDYQSLDGKRVGVAKGSIQTELFLKWEEAHDIHTELTELSMTEEEAILLLGTQLDAYVTMNVFADPKSAVPVWKIGSSDYYFAVSKKRPDLLTKLNDAMSRIQDENTYFNHQLYDKYLKNTETNLYLSTEEKDWLTEHGTIRVGYQDNYLAFCAKDKDTGELVGALRDFLNYSQNVLENATLDFETIAYPTMAEAMEALQKGEVDCVFPANLKPYDAEVQGVVMTPVIMKTEMDAIVRSNEVKELFQKSQVYVAVNRGNTNYEAFLREYFPNWQSKYYTDTNEGLRAIAKGEADCLIISNYRYSNIGKLCEKLHLTSIYAGVDLEYYIALRRGDTSLYSILAKIVSVIPESVAHAALSYYSAEDAKTSLVELIRNNIGLVMTVVSGILFIILVLMIADIRWQKRAILEHRKVESLNKQVYVDALTHVRNKGGYDKYIAELDRKIAEGDEPDVAIGMFDCNDLKKINDKYGHEKGDIYLQTATKLICKVFQHSPVFRIGGDEFVVIMTGGDFVNRNMLVSQFETAKQNACAVAKNPWELVDVAFGIAIYDKQTDHSVEDTLKRADELMYENKNASKCC